MTIRPSRRDWWGVSSLTQQQEWWMHLAHRPRWGWWPALTTTTTRTTLHPRRESPESPPDHPRLLPPTPGPDSTPRLLRPTHPPNLHPEAPHHLSASPVRPTPWRSLASCPLVVVWALVSVWVVSHHSNQRFWASALHPYRPSAP